MTVVLRRFTVLITVGVLVLAAVAPASAGAPATVRDEFRNIAFDGDDGTVSWAGDWRELPIGDGPNSGQIRVVDDSRCAAGKCLRLGDETLIAGISRGVDLSGYTTATLTYSYRRQMSDGAADRKGRILVRVAPDLWSWTTVATHLMVGSDSGTSTQTIDVSEWADGPLNVAFFGIGDLGGFFFIDNVQIAMSSNRDPRFDDALPDRGDTEGDLVSITPQASDPDDDELTFSATGLPDGVSIDSRSGMISGTIEHTAATNSPYTTVVTVTDDVGGTAGESFTWTVADLNRAPSLDPIADVVAGEGVTIEITVDAGDPDLPGDSLQYALSEAPFGASVNSSGRISWTPGETAGPGTHGFTVKVTDSGNPALSASRSFDVTVVEVNKPPTIGFITDQANGVGDAVAFSVTASDPDVPPNTLAYSAAGLPPGVSIDTASGEISGVIARNAPQSNNTVTVTVKDNGSPRLVASQSFSWQITKGNHAPVLAPVTDQSPNASGLVTFTATATDTDSGDVLNFWLADGIDPVPAGASINPSTGKFTWTPTDTQHGATYRINVGVSDSGSPRLSDTQLVTLTIPKLNVKPSVANPNAQDSSEGDAVSLAIDASDPDGDDLRFGATGLPPGLTIDPATGVISGEIDFEAAPDSPYFAEVTATDAGVPQKSESVTFEWRVAETNRPPTAASVTVLVVVGEATPITLDVEDPDGDELEYSLNTPPTTGSVSGDGLEVIYSTPGGADRDYFSYLVSDGEFEVEAEVLVEIRAGNTPPSADADEYEGTAGELIEVGAPGVLGNDSDLDAESLTAVVVSNPAHGTLNLAADGSFTYMPNDGFSGGDKFVYAAIDAFGERATATVVLSVKAPVVVVPEAVADDPRINVIAASQALSEPAEIGEDRIATVVRRTVVAAVNAGISTLPEMKYPLLLLAIALLLGLTVGRVSVLPVGAGKREEEGMVQAYDEIHQVGRVLCDDEETEVFVHGRALDKASVLTPGERVRFVAADMRGRRIALKVWPVS